MARSARFAMTAARAAISRTGAATSSSDRIDRSELAADRRPALPAAASALMEMNVRAESTVLKMIRQQHDAIGIVPGRFQGIDVAQHLVTLQIDHRDGSVAHAFQIEKAILNEQVPLIQIGRAS